MLIVAHGAYASVHRVCATMFPLELGNSCCWAFYRTDNQAVTVVFFLFEELSAVFEQLATVVVQQVLLVAVVRPLLA